MNDDAKQTLKDDLIAHLREATAAAQDDTDVANAALQIDDDEPHDPEDQAQASEASERVAATERAAARAQREIEDVEALDVSPTDRVRPGAVVAFDGAHYVVGVVTDTFESGGVSYEGISADSPVFAAIEGLGAGDTFTINGREHRLDEVG